jgi:hypothetical protein
MRPIALCELLANFSTRACSPATSAAIVTTSTRRWRATRTLAALQRGASQLDEPYDTI